jgi:hypothetical protein
MFCSDKIRFLIVKWNQVANKYLGAYPRRADSLLVSVWAGWGGRTRFPSVAHTPAPASPHGPCGHPLPSRGAALRNGLFIAICLLTSLVATAQPGGNRGGKPAGVGTGGGLVTALACVNLGSSVTRLVYGPILQLIRRF